MGNVGRDPTIAKISFTASVAARVNSTADFDLTKGPHVIFSKRNAA